MLKMIIRWRMFVVAFGVVVGVLGTPALAQFGGFGPRTDIAAPTSQPTWGGEPGSLAAGDLNGNGHIDIVVRGINRIGVFLNDEDGGLLPAVLYDKGPSSSDRGVRVVDLNANGFPDIVISRSFIDSWVSVWLNNGDGTFGARTDYPAPAGFGSCRFFDVGDITGNGFPDIVVGDENTGSVLIFGNDGTGTFALIDTISPPNATLIWSLAAGDIDSDGTVDLLLACRLNDNATMRLFRYRNDGKGNLTPDATLLALPANQVTRELTLVDLNLSGANDLVFGLSVPGGLHVMLNAGNGNFAPFQVYATDVPGTNQIAIADINGNGYPDVAVGNNGTTFGSGTTSVLINDQSGGFEKPVRFSNAGSGTRFSPGVVLADLDGNSTPDLVSLSREVPFQATFLNYRLNLTDVVAPGDFSLLTPADNTSGLPLPELLAKWPGGAGSAPLTWSLATGFINTYTVTIALSPALSNPVHQVSGLTERRYEIPTGVLQTGTRYYWGVTASNIAGATVSMPEVFSFTTLCVADLNADGVINADDLGILLGQFGQTCK